jgi:DNA-binding CsgD family transcriptional regulator
MGTRTPAIGRDRSSDGGAFAEANEVIRQLVACLIPPAEPGQQPGQPLHCEEIVLDTDVDGVRYLLVRLPKPTRLPVSLSPREEEIVRMVAQGYQNKIIAGVLNISTWTVCTHLRRIFAKLGVTSRAAMVARLLEEGSVRDVSETLTKLALASARGVVKPVSAASVSQSLSHRTE